MYNIPFVKTKFLLSQDTVLHGPLQALCGGRIDGLVKGYVVATGRVVIGKKAEIKGDVTANSVTVYGRVYGNIICDDTVLVYNSGYVKGDITAKTIEVKQGAQVEGIIIKLVDPADEKQGQGSDTLNATAVEEEPAEPVIVEPVRSTDKDRDATKWF